MCVCVCVCVCVRARARARVWYKLFKLRLVVKILAIFRSMYATVKSCVRKGVDNFSDFFEIAVGLRQLANKFTCSFALFLEDIELSLQNGQNCELSRLDICIILLLFADDMVIIGNSVTDLQNSLNELQSYCDKWGLQVNVAKKQKCSV